MSVEAKELTLLPDGRFKHKTWGIKEVKVINNNITKKGKELKDLTGLSESTISSIKQSLQKGEFNNYLDATPSDITVNDGVHINIYQLQETQEITRAKLKRWSLDVRKRGNYTCERCQKRDVVHSQAHHIFPQYRYPELALDPGNGIILCQSCHDKYHRKYEGEEDVYTLVRWLHE